MPTSLSPILTSLFWLIILAALVGAAWWVLRASAKSEATEGDRADLDVYSDQVTEIERDLAQGRISAEAAEAGKLEIGRRLVKARDRILTQGPRANRLVLGGMAAGVALLAGSLYALSGNPGRADLPFQARERELLSRDPATLTQDEILLLLQERARIKPDDPQPHALMGQVLASAGRDQDALRAYQAVLRRSPNDAEAIAEAAGILTRLNDGKVGADAQAAFEAALKIDPKSGAALYYLALEDWEAGRRDAAFSAWARAYAGLSASPQAQELLVARAAEVMSQLDRGPDAPTRKAVGQTPATDQRAFITSMVASRRARLAASPNDVALRLSVVRVLMMTGDIEAARRALLEGVERADEGTFELALYGAVARALPTPQQATQNGLAPVTKR
jgi:cytochrome c-type biogenesis protein CcmH